MKSHPPHRAWALLAALALLTACGATRAERSRLGDEADVVERGDCEVGTAFERRRVRGEASQQQSTLQLVCGLGWRTELTINFARQRGDGDRDEAVGLEARTSLRDSSQSRPGWALIYGAGRERSAAGPWHRSDHSVALEASLQPAAAWLVEAQIGTARDRLSRGSSTTWALSIERSVTETIELQAGLGGDDRDQPLASLELRWRPWIEDMQISVSGGARGGPHRERRMGVGLTFDF